MKTKTKLRAPSARAAQLGQSAMFVENMGGGNAVVIMHAYMANQSRSGMWQQLKKVKLYRSRAMWELKYRAPRVAGVRVG